MDDLGTRTRRWFRFTGGDTWSTYARTNAPKVDRSRQVSPSLTVSGYGGELSRGLGYLKKEAEKNAPENAMRRFADRATKYWVLLPEDVKRNARYQYQEELLNSFIEGTAGFQCLDVASINTRYRRTLPTPTSGVAGPLFSLMLAKQSFRYSPIDRANAKPIRDLTNALIPEWADVPYFHEVAETRNDPRDNKVTIQPTHWEVNEQDFLENMDYALGITGLAGISMDTVRREMENPTDGRNRTNSLFERILWHSAGNEQLVQINRLISR